jgi:transglutaminase-like putative cysteine protease
MNRIVIPVVLILCLFSCKEEGPVILSIDPKVGANGETLTIIGERFGAEREGAYITIAATPPISSAYIEWSDTRIRVAIPAGETGLLYVHRNGLKSNPAVFANQSSVPDLVQRAGSSMPSIEAIKPTSGAIGSLITIQGSGFGAAREGGGVFFPWEGEAGTLFTGTDSDYELWNDREIRVRVPDGATGGPLEIRTGGGTSKPVAFTITGKPGSKTYTERKRYTITYMVDIQVESATIPNTLYLWVPEPVSSASQSNIERLERSMTPLAEQYQGTTIFQLNDLASNNNTGLRFSYMVDVYAIETSIQPQPARTDTNAAQVTQNLGYTMPTTLIPSDNETITKQVAAIIGRERNVYNQARLIYEWLIGGFGVQTSFIGNSALEAFEQKRADSFSASLLFCALSRATGIVAIPVAGVLIDRTNKAIPHYWVEFWLDNFGWVPLDPALGSGAVPAAFDAHNNPSTYYFGNLDNQRIAFSRGFTTLSQMDLGGRIKTRNGAYALQSLWEEAVGGLEAYTSRWSDIIISGSHLF